MSMEEQHQSQPSSSSSPPPPREVINSETKAKSGVPYNSTLFGRHRMAAANTRLQNEINIIEKELEQLETIGGSSIVCRELVSVVESIPDPILPETRGPTDVNWDRWFRGAHNGRNHRRWI